MFSDDTSHSKKKQNITYIHCIKYREHKQSTTKSGMKIWKHMKVLKDHYFIS